MANNPKLHVIWDTGPLWARGGGSNLYYCDSPLSARGRAAPAQPPSRSLQTRACGPPHRPASRPVGPAGPCSPP